MMLDLYTITSAEIGHMTERLTSFQKSVTKVRLVRTKIFQFETLFRQSRHVTTTEILHINVVFPLVNAKSHR